jgi:hypothetical protein
LRASSDAAQLTHAKLFSGRTTPVTMRVSDSAVRYLLVPEKLMHLRPEEAAKQPADSLSDELTQRIAREPVVFELKAQVAEPGDQTKDGRQARPLARKVVELDVLTLNEAVPNSNRAAHLPSQSWDQENLKRNDQGCPRTSVPRMGIWLNVPRRPDAQYLQRGPSESGITSTAMGRTRRRIWWSAASAQPSSTGPSASSLRDRGLLQAGHDAVSGDYSRATAD